MDQYCSLQSSTVLPTLCSQLSGGAPPWLKYQANLLSLQVVSQCYTVKHYFFRCILISLFPYVENLLHFKLSYFPVNFIKEFFPVSFGVSTRFYCQNSYCIIVYITYCQEYCISYHGSVDILCRYLC